MENFDVGTCTRNWRDERRVRCTDYGQVFLEQRAHWKPDPAPYELLEFVGENNLSLIDADFGKRSLAYLRNIQKPRRYAGLPEAAKITWRRTLVLRGAKSARLRSDCVIVCLPDPAPAEFIEAVAFLKLLYTVDQLAGLVPERPDLATYIVKRDKTKCFNAQEWLRSKKPASPDGV